MSQREAQMVVEEQVGRSFFVSTNTVDASAPEFLSIIIVQCNTYKYPRNAFQSVKRDVTQESRNFESNHL